MRSVGGAGAGFDSDTVEEDELNEMAKKISNSNLPDRARKTAQKELKVATCRVMRG